MENIDIGVRAFVTKAKNAETKPYDDKPKTKKKQRKPAKPSGWVLAFDTETTIDAAQRLRFGTYQIYKAGELLEIGVFYDSEVLSTSELETLTRFAKDNNYTVMPVNEFIDGVFFRIGYDYRGTIVGFNLPFDISRLAIDHAPARVTKSNKIMQGGFSFKLSEKPYFPRVQIKHVSSRNSFIQFAATKGQRNTRGERKKRRYRPVRRGYFIDNKTLAAALTSTSHSLDSLAKFLNVTSQKHKTDKHGKELTTEYISYAMQDTQVTYECFKKLNEMYLLHGLQYTEAHTIHSEASLGKAYLKEMGIQPWKNLQPDFPPEMLGQIMSTYYGGRSEIHIRREVTQVLYCDFLSMYPTVCTLMGLWGFVIAQGISWQDTTKKTKEFLDKLEVTDLQTQETWKQLTTIVQVMPDNDIFPIRAKYDDDIQYTIGSNYLTSEQPLWFTLADCISSKLLTGKTPQIIKAISFTPNEIQEGLKPVNIAGNIDYSVNPIEGDFFKRVIDLRSSIKKEIKQGNKNENELESQQLALKILANSTSYGVFVELNVEKEKLLQDLICYGAGENSYPIRKSKYESTGTFFFPILATLITGAARLMLATTEHLAMQNGINWAFCDTDSMALAKPSEMNEGDFINKAKKVQEWFTELNPYAAKAPLLKIEDYNYDKNKKLKSLYCYAVSSKRYALFNLENNKPILRKVSAHGLGHLKAPYEKAGANMLEDAQPWQQDLWLEIINAELENRLADFSKLKNFNTPAISRYSLTTTELEKWFSEYNKDKEYHARVTPFNFLLAMQSLPDLKETRPVAPFHKDHKKAVSNCFDRITGEKVAKSKLKTYLDALPQYHIHSESKFLNADFLDKGYTERRHVFAKAICYIGKEANKWEEQFFTGYNPDSQIEYGICKNQKKEMLEFIINSIKTYGIKAMADNSKLSERHISKINNKKANLSEKAIHKLYSAGKKLEKLNQNNQELIAKINKIIKEKNVSIRSLAKSLNIDASNLAKILSGRRKNTDKLSFIYEFLISLHD
jgi:hypothetical protein